MMAPEALSANGVASWEANGFDANKKGKYLKRNVTVDRNGFILGRIVCSTAIHARTLRYISACRTITPTIKNVSWTVDVATSWLTK